MTADPVAQWRAGRPGHGRRRPFDRGGRLLSGTYQRQGGGKPEAVVRLRTHVAADGRTYARPLDVNEEAP